MSVYTPLDVYYTTEAQIYEALDAGELNNEEANEVLTEALVDLAEQYQITPEQALEELEALEEEIVEEMEIEEDEVEYGSYDNYSNFSMSFGDVLAELAVEEFGDIETGIENVAYQTDLDVSEVIDIMEGIAQPDAELTEQLAGIFEATQEEQALLGFLTLAANGRGEELGDVYNLSDEDEEEGYEEAVSDAELAVAYASEVDAKLTNFQQEQAIGKTLNQLIDHANVLVENGLMYPVEYDILFSQVDKYTGESIGIENFSEEDRLACFTDLCIANGFNNAEDQFKAIELVLSVCEKRGQILPMGKFSSEVKKENRIANFNSEEDSYYNKQAEIISQQLQF